MRVCVRVCVCICVRVGVGDWVREEIRYCLVTCIATFTSFLPPPPLTLTPPSTHIRFCAVAWGRTRISLTHVPPSHTPHTHTPSPTHTPPPNAPTDGVPLGRVEHIEVLDPRAVDAHELGAEGDVRATAHDAVARGLGGGLGVKG